MSNLSQLQTTDPNQPPATDDGRGLLSEDINQIAAFLWTAISRDKACEAKISAQKGVDYYNAKHDILEHRIFYIDGNGVLQENHTASNIKIPHPFLTEIIDQEVQYLFSNPVEFEVESDDEDAAEFKERLEEYYDDDFQLFLQEAKEGAAQKGFEYIFARTTDEDRLKFQVADSRGIFPVFGDDNEVHRIVRYYSRWVQRTSNTRPVLVTKAEVYDQERVWYFQSQNNNLFSPDPHHPINPAPHVLALPDGANDSPDLIVRGDDAYVARAYGTIPFFRLSNNREERSTLESIKPLIDDYDLMNAFMSNNLQDYDQPIFVVKGFPGDNLDELAQNIRGRKVVGLPDGENNGMDVKTFQIPIEGRVKKMEIDRQNIYKVGMAMDISNLADSTGNVTNVQIMASYGLLNMKGNKSEARLRVMLKWINQLVVADINRRYGTSYDHRDVKFEITREVIVNERDNAEREKLEAETRMIAINTILAAAPKLDDESGLKMVCEQLGLDWAKVQEMLDNQDFTSGLTDEPHVVLEHPLPPVLRDTNVAPQNPPGVPVNIRG